MPITIQNNKLQIRNAEGNYVSIDAVSDATVAERIAEINAAGATNVGNVNSAGATQVSAINTKATEVTAQLASSGEMEDMVAQTFNTSTAYSAGTYVIQTVNNVNKLYRFNTDHAAGAWNASEVTEIKLGNEVSDLKSALDFTNTYVMSEMPIELSDDVSVKPDVLLGNYRITLSEGAKIYSGTVNAAELLGMKEGTFTESGVTITVSGNTVTVSGQPSATTYFSLADGEAKKMTELAAMTLPLPVHRYTLSQKVTSGTVFPSLLVRSKTSGVAISVQNNTAQFTMDTAVHGGLFLYLDASKNFECTFKIALFPYNTTNGNTFREETSDIQVIEEGGVYALNGSTWNVGNVELSEIISKLPKKPQLLYSTRTIAYSSMQECLDVYIPAKVGYVDYIFGRTQGQTPQAEGGGNVWRLVQVNAVGEAFDYRFHITQLGETEMAIQILGRDDFIGGTTHGDEWMDPASLVFSVDGKIVDIATFTERTEFTTLKCFLVSNMYDPADHTTLVGVHGREWVFDGSGLYIGQTVEYKTALTLGSCYMPMVCALRGNDSASTIQVTDTYIDDGNYQNYDVAVGGFTTYPNKLKQGIERINLYGQTSGVNITVDFLEQPENLNKNGCYLFNGVNTYNKIYNCICGYGNSQANSQAVNDGDKWRVKAKIAIDVGN